MYGPHKSVFFQEVKTQLGPHEGPRCFLDCTFGGGGHSLDLLSLHDEHKVVALDQDEQAIENGKRLIEQQQLQKRLFLIQTNFENVLEAKIPMLDFIGAPGFDGIILDAGVSSHQFDTPERGFSFRFEAKLDMRMDQTNDHIKTAANLVNELDEQELTEIFQEYGEERYSQRIAQKIIEERQKSSIETTKDLENIIFHCYPKKQRFQKIHPATRVFQALRIAVNRELDVLKNVLPDLFTLLSPGGKLAVISFHSLEDRIVKHTFKQLARENPSFKILTKRPLIPTNEEIEHNSRARSAKMRVITKI